MLLRRDPLSERVHLGKLGVAGISLVRHAQGAHAPRRPVTVRPRRRSRERRDRRTRGRSRTARHAAARSISPCASCRKRSARRCSRSIRSAARSMTSPTKPARAMCGSSNCSAGAPTSTRFTRGTPPPHLSGLARAVRDFDLQREDFLAVIDGMEMDVVADIRAPDFATFDLYCDRVASAVGRLSVRVFGMEKQAGLALAHHLGPRAANHEYPARPRRGRRHRPPLSAARSAGRRRHRRPMIPRRCWPIRRSAKPARPVAALAGRHFAEADAIMARSPRRTVRTPRIMATAYRMMLDRMIARGWQPPRQPVRLRRSAIPLDLAALRDSVMARSVHIIGAGLAGLATAVRLAEQGVRATVYEATNQAGGRCRSYHDPALGITIDNGNHLLLSGNRAALGYLDDDRRERPSGRACRARVFPSSISRPTSAGRCAPMTAASRGGSSTAIGACRERARAIICRCCACCARRRARPSARCSIARARSMTGCSGRFCWPRSTPSRRRVRRSLAAAVIRETLAAGGRSYRPLFARDGLSAAFVEPALRFIEANGGTVVFGQRLAGIRLRGGARDGARFRRCLDTAAAGRCRRPGGAAGGGGIARPGPDGADRISRHRQRPFPPRAARRARAHDRHHQWHGRVAVRFSRPSFGHDQRRRSAARYAARGTRGPDLAGSRRGRGHCRPPAPVANRAGAAGDLRGFAARGRQTPRARGRVGTISCSPAIGRRPACRRRSRARSAPATGRPI